MEGVSHVDQAIYSIGAFVMIAGGVIGFGVVCLSLIGGFVYFMSKSLTSKEVAQVRALLSRDRREGSPGEKTDGRS